MWTHRGLDEAGLPVVTKGDDIEGGGDESIGEYLKGLPCLFLLNKNDKKEFKGIEVLQSRFDL